MDEFYEALYMKAGQMFAILAPIAFVFIVVGLWTTVSGSGRSASNYLKAIAKTAVYALVLSQYITWIDMFEESVQSLVYGTLNADPSAVYERYKALADDPSKGETGGFWYSVFHLSSKGFFKGIIAAVLWSAQFVAKITVYIAYVVYKIALAFLIATAPFFIGCLAARSTFHTGIAFIFGTVGVLLWPLGWGFASLVTDAFLTVFTSAGFVEPDIMGGVKNLFAMAAAGMWIIFSTITSPMILHRVLTTGAGMGTALLSGGYSAAKSGVQSGTTAGAALAISGIGAPLAGLGGAAVGAAAFGSSALSNSGSSSSGMIFGNLVRMGECAFSNRGGDSSEEGSRPAYNDADPANDQQVADLIRRSKGGGC